MTIDLAALEALLANATPGPWRRDYVNVVADNGDGTVCRVALIRCVSDADFVVAAVNALPALIARVRELERERDRYHDTLLSRHGGEPLALLDELDTARAEIRTAALAMRERCAHVCNEIADIHPEARTVATICAAAIRAIEP